MYIGRFGTVFCCAFLLIIALQPAWQSARDPLFFLLLGTGTIATCGMLLARIRLVMTCMAICATAALVAIVCIDASRHVPSLQTIDGYNGANHVVITGIVADAPEFRPLSTRLLVNAVTVMTEDGTSEVTGVFLVDDKSGKTAYTYGDHVRVAGLLQSPREIGEGYARYLATQNIFSVVDKASVSQTGTRERTSFPGLLLSLRMATERRINQLLPEPHAAFLTGLLTGTRTTMPEDVLATFRNTGLTHIIAISGYNITLVLTCI